MVNEKKREKFKKDYIRITKKQYDQLSKREKLLYDKAKEDKNMLFSKDLTNKSSVNLALVPKKFKDRGFGALTMVDSESYETIKRPMFVGSKKGKELLQKRIDRADTSEKDKSYLVDVGIKGPLPRPLTTEQKNALSKIISSGKYEDPLKSKEAQAILNKNKGGSVTKKRFGSIDYRKGGMVVK